MLTYNLSQNKDMSMYEFLYSSIKSDILSGKIASGEKLPSKRTLSQHLKISVITVQNAYGLLEDEGYIYAVEKKGYFVNDIQPRSIPDRVSSRKYAKSTEEKQDDGIIDLINNRANAAEFPFSVWSRLMRLVLSDNDKALLSASPHMGVYELRCAICDFLRDFRALDVTPEQVVIGAGTEYLYNLIIQLLGRDKIFALENPGYLKIAKIYAANNVSYKSIDIDKFGIQCDKLYESNADVVHISPSHHYPTGIITPIGRRQEILRWASESKVRYVIEDDYDSEFRFSAKPVETLFGLDGGQRVIYVNTFSKTLCPSIRISYMVLPMSLLSTFSERLGFYACTVPVFEQYTLCRFLTGGYFEKHISRMKNRYKSTRDRVIRAIEGCQFADKVTIREEHAGLHFLLEVDTQRSDEEIKKLCLGAGIRVSCLSDYLHSPSDIFSHKVVINYSALNSEMIDTASERIAKIKV